ncbi:hypothetical protein BB561_006179 [Smittium simulii]|uniref:Arrestin C-terminal-like domain-containing protein n=1 Tax=Smittium simulii TaxID=133385 RepID=A0A2T9Y630_9FUNG|nr:hypothetical protein BB561_006179 [Smittium simulii]
MFTHVSMSLFLPTNVILFYGPCNKAKARVFYGTVILDIHKPTKVKTLYIKVKGKAEASKFPSSFDSEINYGNYPVEEDILKHKEIIFDHSDDIITMNPGSYEFGFCISFDSKLPETMMSDYGNISYSIKAVLVKCSNLTKKLNKSMPIYVRRLTNRTTDEMYLPRPIEISIKLNDILWVKLNSVSNCYMKGQEVNLVIKVHPICSQTKVRSIIVSIVEYFSIIDPKNLKPLKTQTKIIKSAEKVLDFTPGSIYGSITNAMQLASTASNEDLTGNNNHDFDPVYTDQYISANSKCLKEIAHHICFNIPKSKTLLQHDLSNTIFAVKHRLRFNFMVDNGTKISKITMTIPIYIVPNAFIDDLNDLPSYSSIDLNG